MNQMTNESMVTQKPHFVPNLHLKSICREIYLPSALHIPSITVITVLEISGRPVVRDDQKVCRATNF